MAKSGSRETEKLVIPLNRGGSINYGLVLWYCGIVVAHVVRKRVLVGTRIALQGRGTVMDGVMSELRRIFASEKMLA
jgi:hypothetical protein